MLIIILFLYCDQLVVQIIQNWHNSISFFAFNVNVALCCDTLTGTGLGVFTILVQCRCYEGSKYLSQ